MIEQSGFHSHGRRRLLAGSTATVVALLSGARHPVWAEPAGDHEFMMFSKLVTGQ